MDYWQRCAVDEQPDHPHMPSPPFLPTGTLTLGPGRFYEQLQLHNVNNDTIYRTSNLSMVARTGGCCPFSWYTCLAFKGVGGEDEKRALYTHPILPVSTSHCTCIPTCTHTHGFPPSPTSHHHRLLLLPIITPPTPCTSQQPKKTPLPLPHAPHSNRGKHTRHI